jgi:hypothetical protein
MWRLGVCMKWGGDQRDTLHRSSASWREEGEGGRGGEKEKGANRSNTHTLSLSHSLCGVNRIFLSSIITWWMYPLGYIERRTKYF